MHHAYIDKFAYQDSPIHRLDEIRGFDDNDGIIRFIWLEDLVENNLAQLFQPILIQTHFPLLTFLQNLQVEEQFLERP